MRADALRNREKIVAVAEEVLQEVGADFSMDALAKRAGVGAGTLYRHFPDKDYLLAAVLEARQIELPDPEALLARSDSAYEALRFWIGAQLNWVHSFNNLAQPLLEASSREYSTPLGLHCSAVITSVERLVAAAREEGSVRPDLDGAVLYRAVLGLAWASWGEPQPENYLAVLERGWAQRSIS
ncbi:MULTISPECIES: TetR/AcrR family transcriptional regulator [unclassified Corynebacterium]|uniref:TetR/AcrR family transcriptional regulator n=1 Tax=unclassified Corynebacterium TaxID=2624378 RepID=UPI0029CA3105|nr:MULTISPECIES: TetR family transcriptional regulator [unclassified Corynebacterium]WPF65676.1 TetR family transcriptional regulator [Corynebacterium sp. 22KM0430]WPF68172.1 TetR family transcriptional regulator [Corynebacterium sp. 21KM1197]